MQKLGLFALALSASVLADAAESPAAVASTRSPSVVGTERPVQDIRDIELGKRVYFYKYLTEDYMAALTAPDAEPSLKETEVSMTLPVSFLNMGMDHYALGMINDPGLKQRGGLGNSWFVLAQRASERGDWEQAYDFASRAMESNALLSPASVQENRYILITSLATTDQLNSAIAMLDEMSESDRWYYYALYNVMLAEMRQGMDSDALARRVRPVMRSMEAIQGYDQALKDRFLLTAGRYELESKNYAVAVDYLRMVSSDGPFASEALLQYGWALSRQWLYDQALQPWRVLQDNFYRLDLNVLESLMATPYVAELLNGGIESLNVYEYAERQMTSALYDIERLNDPETLNSWVNTWSGVQSSTAALDGNWLEPGSQLVSSSEVSRALESLLNTSGFLEAQQQLQDIDRIQQWAEQQKQHIQEQNQWADETRVLGEETGRIDQLRLQLAELKAVQARTKRWIETEESTPYPYADEAEMAMLRHLDQLRQETAATSAEDSAEYAALNKKAATLLGLQGWKVFKQVPVRRWETVKVYLELGHEVNAIAEQLAGLQQLEQQLQQHQVHLASRKQRLNGMIERLDELIVSLEPLRQRQKNHVVTLAGEHLNMLDSRLKEYLATTRLSIARLYDNELRRNANSVDEGDYE